MKYSYEILPGHMVSPARYSFQRKIYPYLKKHIGPEDTKILDFGCGSAVFRFYFKDRIYFGFDIRNQNFAAKQERNVSLIVADGRAVPFRDCSFDFVFCNAVFEHIEDDVTAAREAFRVLKEGKYCYVIVPSFLSPVYDEIPIRVLAGEGHGEHYYSRKQIVDLLNGTGFQIEQVTTSMGLFCSALKTFYIYQRALRIIFCWALRKLFKIRCSPPGIYSDTNAWGANDFEDLQRIQDVEYRQEKRFRYIYRKLLEVCFYLDSSIAVCSRVGCEWLVIARKPAKN